jgi:hypothetical protein
MFFSSPFVPSYQQYGVVCKAILIDECRNKRKKAPSLQMASFNHTTPGRNPLRGVLAFPLVSEEPDLGDADAAFDIIKEVAGASKIAKVLGIRPPEEKPDHFLVLVKD